MSNSQIFWNGTLASLLAGLATGLGALPILFLPSKKLQKISHRTIDMLLSFAAGIMLAASVFSLIIPAIELGNIYVAMLGIFLGAFTIEILDRYLPHEHFEKGYEGPKSHIKKIWLFVIAITLHNFPEGMAVGVSFGGNEISTGVAVALAIGIQNIPEGTAVATSFLKVSYSRFKIFWIALLTGLVEPLGGLIGAGLVVIARPLLPFFLSFAGGAMLYIISDEIIPESHSKGNETFSTFSLIFGFLIMMFLDNFFG
ncbi:MAG: zinc transporter, family [Thermotogaceae bacterium]|jgi:ZIP family zinc transporter|nr:zinc transporter, family [Thermotogaceae bacterium]MDN5336989.1 zinc transporter, family [Thermotogaceae bacterium]